MIHKKLLSLLVLLMTTVSMSAYVPVYETHINVTVPTGNAITIDLMSNSTVAEIKEKIEAQTHIPIALQILTFDNHVLVDNDQTLSDLYPAFDPTFTLSLVSGNYYLNDGSTQNCPVSFKVGNSDGVVTAHEDDVVTVTFTPTAPYVLTAVTAQAYTTWAGARRAVPEPTLTIPMLGDIELTPVQGQDNTYTFTMPPSHVTFNTTLRQPSGLAWMLGGNKLADGATVNYCKGFPFTAPVLVKPDDLVCQLKADDGITIDVNGAVTVDDDEAQPGTHTITATIDDDGTYQATTVKFNLVISEPAILSVAADPTTGGTVEVVIPESELKVKEITGDMVAGWNQSPLSEEYMIAGDLEGFEEVPLDVAKTWKPDNLDKTARLYYAFEGTKAKYALFGTTGNFATNRSDDITKGYAWEMILSTGCTVPSYYTTGYTPVTVIANQDGTYSVVPGTSVTLKATAANGYQLNGWSQNVTPDNDDNTVATITVNETATATAYFGEKEYEVDLTVNGDDDQGTEKAKWTGKAGEQGTAEKFPITAKTGQMVIANYNGSRKVKSVKAVLVPTYLKWDATKKEWVEAEIPATFTPVENADGDVTWAAGTYLVEGNVTINGGVTLKGDVELIIKDGAKLNANQIKGGNNYSLNIYGQANKSGELNVACSYGDAISKLSVLNIHNCKVNASSSSDNYGGFYGIGELNVYGGSVDAKYIGDSYGYGLGDISSLKIWGGEMKAEGKGDSSYGITCWYGTNVTVYGGKLWVKNADLMALRPVNGLTFTKADSYTKGKIQTSDDGENWDEYTDEGKPETKYVRVGY